MRLPRCILAVLVSVSLSAAADRLSINVSSGELRGVDADGVPIWRIQTSAESEPVITSAADDSLVVDGVIVSSGGEVVARRAQPSLAPGPIEVGGPVGCPYWEDPAVVTPPPGGDADSHAPLLMDSAGNPWVIITHISSGDYALRVRTFDRAAGVWGLLETISDTTRFVSQPEGAIDGDDNLTIVFRDIDQGYHLYAVTHEPGTGWGPLTPIYSSSTFFQAIEVAADADGDVVVINDFGLSTTSVRSVVYDAAAGTWGSPVQISPAGYNTLLPTLAQNRTGTALYLVYLVRNGGPVGLYGHQWNGASNTWGPAEFIPESQTASFAFAGPVSRFPLTVGGDGEATLLWQTSSPFTVNVSRTQGGSWQAPHEVLPPGPNGMDIENFAYIDANAEGDVIGAFTRFEGPNRFYAFRYDAASGWREAVNPYTSSLNISTRVRVAFYSGARAVGTLLGSQSGQRQLTSLNYDGLDWQSDLLDIPQVHDAFFQHIIADRTEALLVYEAEQGGGNLGIKGTWLRNTVGDLDCDGVVAIDDFAEYLDGDGDADTADFAIMQRVFDP